MSETLPPLREIIDAFDLGAKKSLGQHFLLDLNITRKIARMADVSAGDAVLEIGPGPGGLTRALLETGAQVFAIERDHRCIAALESLSQKYGAHFSIFEKDALKADERMLLGKAAPVKIIANLPYNISTELLIKWLKAGPELWDRMALMFQKEVADRILAEPNSKTYGRLSVISQIASQPSRAFDLPARAFTPPPKVQSTVVLFDLPATSAAHLGNLEKITQAAFSQRRKMVRSSLKTLLGPRLEELLSAATIEPTSRAEDITTKQYAALAELMADFQASNGENSSR